MQRDYNLIRNILLKCEENLPGRIGVENVVLLLEPDEEKFDEMYDKCLYHIELLVDQGFIDVTPLRAIGKKPNYIKHRLTSAGCDYLDSIRDDKIWRKVLSKISKIGGSTTLDIIAELAKTLAKSALGL